jgi:thiol-disulfide isomerase/thioredoxin
MMEVLILGFRAVLFCVLGLAAITKLADLAGARVSVIEFGVPERLSWPVAILLPAAELLTAVLLLAAETVVFGGVSASLLMGAFSWVVARNLARGNRPECHCFGQLSSKPIGRETLFRNLLLLGLSLAITAAGTVSATGPGIGVWGPDVIALLLGATGLVAALGAMAFGQVKNRLLTTRLDALEALLTEAGLDGDELPQLGPPPGTELPDARLWPVAGGPEVHLRDLVSDRPVLLVFINAYCRSCDGLAPDFARWQRAYSDEVSVLVVCGGDAAAVHRKVNRHGLAGVMMDPDDGTFRALGASGVPGAVLIGPDKISSWYAKGPRDVRRLLGRVLSKSA